MIEYILKILPRLKEHSLNIDRKELFIDIPWVMFDNGFQREVYIFKRNNDLVMSLNGDVQIGSWQYLPEIKSLLIDRIKNKILLNQEFIDSSVMVLKKDGYTNDYLYFVNEAFILKEDGICYLKKIFKQHLKIQEVKLSNGLTLEILNYHGYVGMNTVLIDGNRIEDGLLDLENSEIQYRVSNSKIIQVVTSEFFKTNHGVIEIRKEKFMAIRSGDLVFLNKLSAPDGKYRVSLFNIFNVKNGVISI